MQAAIAAFHDQAMHYDDTDWTQVVALYGVLEQMTDNPMVALNRAVAVAMVDGPNAGLALIDGLDERLGDHHRLHSVRAHLLEQAGETAGARAEFRIAASRTDNRRELSYLTMKAAALAAGPDR